MPSPNSRDTSSRPGNTGPDPVTTAIPCPGAGRRTRANRILLVCDSMSSRINQGVEVAVVTCGISMTVIVTAQVFCRYVLNHSLFWSEELARYLLVWLTFLGASVAYRRQAHPGIDLFVSRLPMALRRYSTVLVHMVTLCLSSVMIVSGARFAWFVRLQISPALSLPKWVILSIIPLAGILFLIHAMFFFIRTLAGDHHDQ